MRPHLLAGSRENANRDSQSEHRYVNRAEEQRTCDRGTTLALIARMSNATKTSRLPVEPLDAPRASPPAVPMSEVEATSPEAVDDVLDNPYDNLACTD